MAKTVDKPEKEDKKNTLKSTIEALSKKYGRPIILKGDELPIGECVNTGIPAFDYVNNGGFYKNQINELYGAFSSLKTWICLKAVAKFQKYDWANNVPDAIASIKYKVTKTRSSVEAIQSLTFAEIQEIIPRRGYKPKLPILAKRVAFVDMESTFDRKWAKQMGVDIEGLLYYTTDSMNQAIDVIETLLRDEEICLVVLDSMSIIGSDLENDKSMEDEQMAVNARLWNKAARKLRSAMNSNKFSTLIAINATSKSMSQYEDEVVKNGQQFSLSKSTSVKMAGLKLHTGKPDGVNEVAMGRMIKLANKKHKFGEPFRTSEFYYSLIDDGVLKPGDSDIVQQLVTLGSKFDLIKRTGNTLEYDKLRVAGMESFTMKLRGLPELVERLHTEVYKNINKKYE